MIKPVNTAASFYKGCSWYIVILCMYEFLVPRFIPIVDLQICLKMDPGAILSIGGLRAYILLHHDLNEPVSPDLVCLDCFVPL
jgi:hypothetical protein